jgi:hypothetical protein
MADSDWEVEESPKRVAAKPEHQWGAELASRELSQPQQPPSSETAAVDESDDWEVETNAMPAKVPREDPMPVSVTSIRELSGVPMAAHTLDTTLERSGDSWQIEKEGGSDPLAESNGSWTIESPHAMSTSAPTSVLPNVAQTPVRGPTARPSLELVPPPVSAAPTARKTRDQPRGAAAVAASVASIPSRALRPGGVSEVWPPPLELRTFVSQQGELCRPKSKEMIGLCTQLQEGIGPLAEYLRRLAQEQAREDRRWHKHTPLSSRAVATDAAFWSCLLSSLSLSEEPKKEAERARAGSLTN